MINNKSKGFVTTGILFSLLVLIIYLITSIVLYTNKIKYNKKYRIDKINDKLDDQKAVKERAIYTKDAFIE